MESMQALLPVEWIGPFWMGLQILLILGGGLFQRLDDDRHDGSLRGTKTDDFAKVISDCFFCHAQMVPSAGSSVLLRPDVAPKWSFTPQNNSHACA